MCRELEARLEELYLPFRYTMEQFKEYCHTIQRKYLTTVLHEGIVSSCLGNKSGHKSYRHFLQFPPSCVSQFFEFILGALLPIQHVQHLGNEIGSQKKYRTINHNSADLYI
jgi:hypothetical protein